MLVVEDDADLCEAMVGALTSDGHLVVAAADGNAALDALADSAFDLDELDSVLALAPACDLVAGYRISRADPLHRRLNAAAWNLLVRRYFDLAVRDVDCAFKLIHRDVLERVLLTADGAMVSTELLVRARAAGAEIAELGVTHRPRVAGRSTGANPAVVLRAFRELRALRAQLRAEDQPAVVPAARARAV